MIRSSLKKLLGACAAVGLLLPLLGLRNTTVTPSQRLATIRAQQILAALHYLPLTWHPDAADPAVSPQQAWTAPPQGQWHWTAQPTLLHTLWARPGVATVMTHGALTHFQRVHDLPMTGTLTRATQTALTAAMHTHATSPTGYNYAIVDEYLGSSHLETFTLYHDGHVILTSPTNTGVAATPTPFGTYDVYLRYDRQDMSGTTPWGTYYNDPGVPFVNYIHGGVAVHGFPRAAYGFPQSLGCIELPIPVAAHVWKYLHYGTLVSVVPHLARD